MNHPKKTLLSTLIASACASFMAATPSAYAQETQSETPKNLEVIVVSSTRTGTDLASTSAAVTALSAKALADSGITDPTNLQDQAPNISIDRAGSSGLQITIRGVSSTDNTEKGDPSAAFLQDGVYIARPQAQEVSFFDLDQVEILRGPQGTLYGRNATAGLINVISAKPTIDEMYGSFDATLGDYGRRQATAMLNVPISDKAAIRAAINVDRRDTYLNKHLESSYDIDPGKDNMSARLSGFFELSDDVSLLVRGDYSSIEGSARSDVKLSNFYDVLNTFPPESGKGVNPTYIADQKSSDELRTVGWQDTMQRTNDNSTWGAMAELNWTINSQLTMTYLGSYREFTRREDNVTGYLGSVVLPFGIIDISNPQLFHGDYEQSSNELRFTYVTDSMNLQGGIYSFSEESAVKFLIYQGEEGQDGYIFGFPQDPTKSDSVAIFGQGSFDLSDKLSLTAGARYTQDEKSRVGAVVNHVTLEEELNFTYDPVTNPIPDSLNNAEVDYNELTWKLGLDYDVSDDILLYGLISTGYKAGGFNDGCTEGMQDCNSPLPEEALYYDPETLTAYELGLKLDLDNGLRTFINVFHYDYQDLQLSNVSEICGGSCQVTSNAGKAEVDGIELESRYYITAYDKLNVALTWLNAEYTDYQLNDTINLKGEKLNRSPEYTAIVSYQHIFEMENGADIEFDISSRWSDEYSILSTSSVSQFVQPSFHKTDVALTYRAPERDWYVQAYVKNIEDELTVSNASFGPAFPGLADGTLTFSDPRTAGVRFGLEF
ncbi:TonB-dependent receptor [Flavobacterium sp. W21_SRS_FM6]|uniref:TonB-dependent receptor n=1 Tax=Flavobacterium sp. W21_SRS_FM6 TaxID=3240268 RepID=UPI003F91448D